MHVRNFLIRKPNTTPVMLDVTEGRGSLRTAEVSQCDKVSESSHQEPGPNSKTLSCRRRSGAHSVANFPGYSFPQAGAIALRFTLAPKEKKFIPMALSWDLPLVQFGGGRKWVRHYTQFFDASGTNAWKIARKTATQFGNKLRVPASSVRIGG